MYKRPTLVDIKLTDEWLGHPKGSKLQLEENQAKTMIERGVAKIDQHWQPSAKAIEEEKDRQALKIAKENHESLMEEQKAEVTSKMQRRDKDKMIRNSENK